MNNFDYIKCKNCDCPLNRLIYGELPENYEIQRYSIYYGYIKPEFDYVCKNEKCNSKFKTKEIFKGFPFNLIFRKKLKNGFEYGFEELEYPKLEIDIFSIKNLINLLDTEKLYNEVQRNEKNDVIEMGYVSYDQRLMDLSNYIPFYEQDYTKNIMKIKNKEISLLTLLETQKYITFIFRGERFCEGHISSYIDNGILKELLNHVVEICEN